MEFKVSVPTIEQAKPFLAKTSVTGVVYFCVAYLGTYITPYIDAISFFELPATALAAAVTMRYGWSGILGSIVGSLFFHLLNMPLPLAITLALGVGIAAFVFNYCLRLFHLSEVVINQVSSVAIFGFIATPIASAVHTLITIFSMQALDFAHWDSMLETMMAWWFSELVIAYLTVPLLLSIFSYRKSYFQTQENRKQ